MNKIRTLVRSSVRFDKEALIMNSMTEKELLEFFPEIALIEKSEWRSAVTQIWLEAYNSSIYMNSIFIFRQFVYELVKDLTVTNR